MCCVWLNKHTHTHNQIFDPSDKKKHLLNSQQQQQQQVSCLVDSETEHTVHCCCRCTLHYCFCVYVLCMCVCVCLCVARESSPLTSRAERGWERNSFERVALQQPRAIDRLAQRTCGRSSRESTTHRHHHHHHHRSDGVDGGGIGATANANATAAATAAIDCRWESRAWRRYARCDALPCTQWRKHATQYSALFEPQSGSGIQVCVASSEEGVVTRARTVSTWWRRRRRNVDDDAQRRRRRRWI